MIGNADDGAKGLLLVWDVSAEQEEPWRRFLQELAGSRFAEPTRRPGGIRAEFAWLAPKPSGGGVAVVFLEAEDPEHALRSLVASHAHFHSWRGTEMRKLFCLDLSRLPHAAGGELLFSWTEAPGPDGT